MGRQTAGQTPRVLRGGHGTETERTPRGVDQGVLQSPTAVPTVPAAIAYGPSVFRRNARLILSIDFLSIAGPNLTDDSRRSSANGRRTAGFLRLHPPYVSKFFFVFESYGENSPYPLLARQSDNRSQKRCFNCTLS